jgi:hypothetical protein
MGKISSVGVVSERPAPGGPDPVPEPDPAEVAELEPVTAEPPRPPLRHAPAG